MKGADVLAGVTAEFERVFGALGAVVQGFADIAGAAAPPGRDALVAIRPAIFAVLDAHRDLVAGAGVIAAPGLLADAPYWLEWWWTRADGTPEALRVNLNPAAPDFFDYPAADWYATPLRTGARHVAGPYVDYACTNEYALTLAVPVQTGAGFAGIAAADVPLSRFEPRAFAALAGLPRPAALVNARGRVVASTSPALLPGALAAPPRRRAGLGWAVLDVPAG